MHKNNVSFEASECDYSNNCNVKQGYIICPPIEERKNYYSSSESSCPDFSDLCEDQPKKCHKKKDLCKSTKSSSLTSAKSLESETLSEVCHNKNKKCNNNKGCGNICNPCEQYCIDNSDAHSVSSVLKSLCHSDRTSSECGNLSYLVHDKKKRCIKKKNLCEKRDESEKRPRKSSRRTDLSSTTSGSGRKGKRFNITFTSKVGHPWAKYNQGEDSIHINGKNGPIIHLIRGRTYFFCVEQDIPEGTEPLHQFILTDSPAGGPNAQKIFGSFEPLSKGCACFKVDDKTPRCIFYQDTKNEFAGGICYVHDINDLKKLKLDLEKLQNENLY